jgi:hypothetical protein
MTAKRMKKRKEVPSVHGLIKLRRQLDAVVRSLDEASARPQDVIARRRIQLTMLEVTGRLQRLRNTLNSVVRLRARRASYEQRIQKIDRRLDTMIGRQFRGNQGWLRKWEKL